MNNLMMGENLYNKLKGSGYFDLEEVEVPNDLEYGEHYVDSETEAKKLIEAKSEYFKDMYHVEKIDENQFKVAKNVAGSVSTQELAESECDHREGHCVVQNEDGSYSVVENDFGFSN